MDQVNQLLKKEISFVLGQIKDKYLGFITVLKVETSKDLSVCRVYISSLEKKKEKELIRIIGHYKAEFYSHIKARCPIKRIPHLIFKVDEMENQINRVHYLLNQVKKDDTLEKKEDS